MWPMLTALALAGAPAQCPEVAAHAWFVPELHAKDWPALATAWKRAFARAHPHERVPELAEDPARLRSQACLPRAPDGRFLTDPREVERLGAKAGCPGDGPWLLALAPESLTLVARDGDRGLVAWPGVIEFPGALVASYRIAVEPERFVLQAELTREKPTPHLEKQLVESLARKDGMVNAVEVREGEAPAKVAVAGEQVTVTAPGCPSAGAKL